MAVERRKIRVQLLTSNGIARHLDQAMPNTQPTISLPRIDWSQHQAGADPYLIWAEITDFRGFNVDDAKFQVTVETPTNAAPWAWPPVPPVGPPSILDDQTRVCSTGNEVTWSGTVDASTLLGLIQKPWKLALNVPRIAVDALVGAPGSAPVASLTGNVIAVIDYGCPFVHQQFLTGHGSSRRSRVRYLWDQNLTPTADPQYWAVPDGFPYGREITSGLGGNFVDGIDALLNASPPLRDEDAIYNEADYSAVAEPKVHGAHVLDLAAGDVNPVTGSRDAASEANIIFVQLPRDTISDSSGGSITKYVLDALVYIFNRATDAKNLVINLSYGSCAGPHDGSSMLERAMDTLIANQRESYPRRNLEVVLPAGNHFLAQGHRRAILDVSNNRYVDLQWQVMPDDATDTFLELWYEPTKDCDVSITVTPPNGQPACNIRAGQTAHVVDCSGKVFGLVVHSDNVPTGRGNMVLIAVRPTHPDVEKAFPAPTRLDANGATVPPTSMTTAPHGVWVIQLSSKTDIEVNAWVERDDPVTPGTGTQQAYFVPNRVRTDAKDDDQPNDWITRRTTGNSIANGKNVTVVGACFHDANPANIHSQPVPSDYSAAGPCLNATRERGWPDTVLPADESADIPGILAAGTRSGLQVRMNGGSVAAPQMARHFVNAWAAGNSVQFVKAVHPKPLTLTDLRVGAPFVVH